MNKKKNSFCDYLDTVWVTNKEAIENLGEDSWYCVKGQQSALVSVCDGCGGLGAFKYETFKGHNGAYMASRIVSGAIHDWYHANLDNVWNDSKDMADSINNYICAAYRKCELYAKERIKILGTMVRKFPTTLAFAYAEMSGERVKIHILWAGDSRVYLLDENGLAQISKDDTVVEDALESLVEDGALMNLLSADGNYKINCKTIYLDNPAMVFVATDGCFGYIPSPMEFEHIIVKTLVNSNTPEMFRKKLCLRMSRFAGDDLTLGMMSFGFGDFINTRNAFKDRLLFLEKTYIDLLNQERSYTYTEKLWKKYKPTYERYLR